MSDSIHYPSISVVIPSFNQGQYIEETILSILGQQYPNLEIIVIDGGSTDNTVEILEQYSDQISYWHSKKDKGQADAINQGMNLSSGEVLCWLNSDDMYLPGTLLDIGQRFRGRTDKSHFIYGSALTIKQIDGVFGGGSQNAAPFEAMTLTHSYFLVQPSTFWTRQLWQCTGELNLSYNYVLDWDWFIRASKVTEFEYVQRFYSVYRYHPLHKTSTGGVERRKEIIEIVTKYSSSYWINLYREVDKCYSQIKKTKKILDSLRMPKRQLLLPKLFPNIKNILINEQDFYSILGIYE
jgi:glycosyltransferase involved in cell wall biosynthesis